MTLLIMQEESEFCDFIFEENLLKFFISKTKDSEQKIKSLHFIKLMRG